MLFPQIKKLQSISKGSKAIIIPNEWISLMRLKPNAEIKITLSQDYRSLILTPVKYLGEDYGEEDYI